MPTVELISITPNYMDLLKTACSMPYGANVSDKIVRKVIDSGHHSVMEHCSASFLAHCSVRVLGQITRHRHLSFTVKSARGSAFDQWINPAYLQPIDGDLCEVMRLYNKMLDDGILTLEQAAYYLPQGVETQFVVSGNFRAWYEYLPWRLCRRAMPEHRILAESIHKELKKAAPEIFDVNLLRCESCKELSCKFK